MVTGPLEPQGDDVDADARALRHRLEHIGQRHGMAGRGPFECRRACCRRPECRRRGRCSSTSPCASRSPKRARPNACRESRSVSRIADMQPSSPHLPCSALKATSGFRSVSTVAMSRSTSIGVDLEAGAAQRARRRPCRKRGSPRAPPTSRPSARRHVVSCGAAFHARARLSGDADALDLPFELDAGCLAHALAHGLAEFLDLRGRGAAFVDQEVAVQLGDLRRADRRSRAGRPCR